MSKFVSLASSAAFSICLFFSAALLFSLEPFAAKKLLPFVGGSPIVWNAAVVTFQALLLLGYVAAFLVSRIANVRLEAAVIATGYAAAWFFRIPEFTPAQLDGLLHGTFVPGAISTVILVTVGPIFITLSVAAPTLQRWYAEGNYPSSHDPYFLYAASNAGSLIALLIYPLLIEPNFNLSAQSEGIGVFFSLVTVLLLSCAALSGLTKRTSLKNVAKTEPRDSTTAAELFGWLMLSAVPSGLMLAVTSYLTTDIAPVPLLWVLPLALYLVTFILAFGRFYTPVIWIERAGVIFSLGLVVGLIEHRTLSLWFAYPLHLIAFFLVSLTLHSILASKRPEPARLTLFFLVIAMGGLLGGMFVTLLAPLIFNYNYEYTILLGGFIALRVLHSEAAARPRDLGAALVPAAAFVIASAVTKLWIPVELEFVGSLLIYLPALLLSYRLVHQRAAFALASILLIGLATVSRSVGSKDILLIRDYFGTVRVYEAKGAKGPEKIFAHGNTLHGTQAMNERDACVPSAYYAENGPVGSFFNAYYATRSAEKVVGIGLGTGSMVCYGKPGQQWAFIELSPTVRDIAASPAYFTYLKNAPSGEVKVIVGDGRLELARFENRSLDLILADAFSSDTIPIHLLTLEAFELYMQKLKRDGAVMLHIANRFLDLQPQISDIVAALGLSAMRSGSSVVLTNNQPLSEALAANGWSEIKAGESRRCWTDSYSNIFGALNFGS